MSEVLIVLRREFLERVRSRAFVIGTVLFPVFMGASIALPALIGAGGGGERTLALVNEAPPAVGDAFVAALTAPAGADRYTYHVERVPGTAAAAREALNRRVLAEEIDGYVVLPPDLVERSQALYRARNISSLTMQRDVSRAASQAAQGARLEEAGLDGARVQALLRPVELQAARITEAGEEAGSAESTFGLAYITGFLVYMLVLLYGVNVMRSVLEEKTNRISEVIISSMKASHLMAGKILGVASVALLQIAIWMTVGAVAVARSDAIAARFGISPDALRTVRVPPWVLASTVAFFLLGFLLYAALFAAMGAAVNSEQEAQQFQTLVLFPLFVPLVAMVRVINEPMGSVATLLGNIPFSAPIIMPMRMAAAPVPAWQVALSLGVLAVSVLAVAWLAGKIYRVGILSTGQKPTFRDLARWLRAA